MESKKNVLLSSRNQIRLLIEKKIDRINTVNINFNSEIISIQPPRPLLTKSFGMQEAEEGNRGDRCGNNERGRATRASRSCSPLLPGL